MFHLYRTLEHATAQLAASRHKASCVIMHTDG